MADDENWDSEKRENGKEEKDKKRAEPFFFFIESEWNMPLAVYSPANTTVATVHTYPWHLSRHVQTPTPISQISLSDI